MDKERQQLRVKATTKPQDLAGAIAKFHVQDKQPVEIIAIGAGSLNQAIKALIMANRFVSSSGIRLAWIPSFRTLNIEDKEITAIVLQPVEI